MKSIDILGKSYLVSENGEIFNESGKKLQIVVDKNGYCSILLKKRRFLIHRLVAKLYLPEYSEEKQVHHKDENKQNNSVNNLECLSVSEHQHLHKQIYSITKVCIVCGNTFIPEPTKRKRALTCSYNCWKQITIINAAKRCKKIAQYSMNGDLIKVWNSAREVQNNTGFHESNINKCCHELIHSYKGFVWKYA